MRRSLSFGILTLILAGSAMAMEPIPGEERFAGLLPPQSSAGAQLGVGQIQEDYYLKLVLKSELNLGKVGVGFQIPLNLRAWDRDPQATNDYYGLIRYEDWDQPADYIKVIRYVRLGHKRDDFYLRVGELAAALGHGTIMGRYINNLDINKFRVGSQFDINTKYGGIETVIGDFGTVYDRQSPDSRLFGARAYFKPYALIDADSLLNIFAIGASVVSDLNAPTVVTATIEDDNLEVTDTTAATIYGFDFEAEVLHSPILDIVPYTDLNFIQQAGWGWHLGTLITAKMPIGFALTIPLRLEYRRFAGNYLPMYFSTFYEIERYQYLQGTPDVVTGLLPTKAHEIRNRSTDAGLNGYYADLAFDFANIFQVGAFYEDYDSSSAAYNPAANRNLQVFVSVPALDIFQLKAFYARTGITDLNDLFKKDSRSMAVAEGRYQLISYVYLVGRFTRRWVLDPEATPAAYVSTDSWDFGVESSFNF